MISFEELDTVAKVAANKGDPEIRDDVYQDAWLRFVAYKPRTVFGAKKMAYHARIDVWRNEMKHRHVEMETFLEPAHTIDALLENRERLRGVPVKQLEYAVAHEGERYSPLPTGADVRRLFASDTARRRKRRRPACSQGTKE